MSIKHLYDLRGGKSGPLRWFQMEQVQRDGNEEHKVEYHKEHMDRNEE